MADKETLNGLLGGAKKTSRNPLDDVIALEKERQQTALYNMYFGGGNGNGKQKDGDSLADLKSQMREQIELEGMKSLLKELRGGSSQPNGEVEALKKQIEDLNRKMEEDRQRREREDQDRKWEERFRELANQIKEGKEGEKGSSSLDRILEEMRREREEDRKEREREQQQKDRDDRLAMMIDESEDRMARLIAEIKEDKYKGKSNDDLKSKITELLETEKLIKALRGESSGETKTSMSDVIDQILEKGDKVVKTGKSIYDQFKGDDDLEEVVPPFEGEEEQFRPRLSRETASIDPEIAAYIERGREMDDPDNPGNKIWVGMYGDAYDNSDGTGMTKDQVELRARIEPEKFRNDILEAKEVYEREMAKRQRQAPPPKEEESAPEIPEEAKEQGNDNEDEQQQTMTEETEE